jgi:hypothetical protein
MSAIITDQIRILIAKKFVEELTSSTNSYYSFIGLPNAPSYKEDWDDIPPAPRDNFDESNDTWDTMIALKKISSDDVRQVIRKIQWKSGTTYDMYRHDISRNNISVPSDRPDIYYSNFYVINEDFRVYICLYNGYSPENPQGKPSLDQPSFTDLEPRSAGSSGDGYVWKYLYSIKPSDVFKFDSSQYIPVPKNWDTSSENEAVRLNASTSGQLKVAVIKNRGYGLGAARTYTKIPIKGDGSGAEAIVVVGNDSRVESISIINGGSGYTYGTVDLNAVDFPIGTTAPIFDVIIPPPGGHGYDIYRELGAFNVLIYSRIENSDENPDFVIGNQIARIGVVQNPLTFDSSSLLSADKVSGVYALKLVGINNINDYQNAKFTSDSEITQTIGTGLTAIGRVLSYDKRTGVLKYWQDRSLYGFNYGGEYEYDSTEKSRTIPTYGYNLLQFTSTPSSGSVVISGGNINLGIDTSFSGITTTINSTVYNLGQEFTEGVSNPEVKKYSGNIIYVDNRPSITRSSNQKEDIKVILQF